MASHPAFADLIADWDFSIGSGAILSDASGKHQGIIKGATWSYEGDSHNRHGYSLLFDGIDDYVDLKSCLSAFPRGARERTIIIWFLPAPKVQPLFVYGSKEKKYGSRFLISTSKTEVSVGFIGHIYGHNNLQLSAWHQLAVVVPADVIYSNDIKIYLDGIDLSQHDGGYQNLAGKPVVIDTGNHYAYIGNNNVEQQFSGQVSKLKLYNHALDATEIAELYQHQSHWNFDGNGNWQDASSWQIHGAADSANSRFFFDDTAKTENKHSDITLDSNVTASALIFNSKKDYTLCGSGNITMKDSNGNATITVKTHGRDSGRHSIATNLFLNSNLLISNNSNNILILSGTINDHASGHSLTKSGEGTVALSGKAEYSGTTLIQNGKLQNRASNIFPDNSAFVIKSKAIYDLNGYTETIASLAGGGRVILKSGNLRVGSGHKSSVYSGSISGTGSLIKTGVGTFTLSGNNSYVGPTELNQGTIVLNAPNTIAHSSALVLTGGSVDTGGIKQAFGVLKMTSDAIIDMGHKSSHIQFESILDSQFDGILKIYNWTGSASSGGGTDQISFKSHDSFSKFDQIQFYSDNGINLIENSSILLGDELVPVPATLTVSYFLNIYDWIDRILGLSVIASLLGWFGRRKISMLMLKICQQFLISDKNQARQKHQPYPESKDANESK